MPQEAVLPGVLFGTRINGGLFGVLVPCAVLNGSSGKEERGQGKGATNTLLEEITNAEKGNRIKAIQCFLAFYVVDSAILACPLR